MEHKFLIAFHIDKDYKVTSYSDTVNKDFYGYGSDIMPYMFEANVVGFRLLNLPSGMIEDVSLTYFISKGYYVVGFDKYTSLSDSLRISDKLVIKEKFRGNTELIKVSNGVSNAVASYKSNVPYLLDGKIVDSFASFFMGRSKNKKSIIKLSSNTFSKLSILCDFMIGDIAVELGNVSLIGSKVKHQYSLASDWGDLDVCDLLPKFLYNRFDRLIGLGNKCIIESRRDSHSTLILLKDVKKVFIGTKDEFDWGNISNLILPPSVEKIVLVADSFGRDSNIMNIGVNSKIPVNELKNLIKSLNTKYKKIKGINNCRSIDDLNKVLNSQGIKISTY